MYRHELVAIYCMYLYMYGQALPDVRCICIIICMLASVTVEVMVDRMRDGVATCVSVSRACTMLMFLFMLNVPYVVMFLFG